VIVKMDLGRRSVAVVLFRSLLREIRTATPPGTRLRLQGPKRRQPSGIPIQSTQLEVLHSLLPPQAAQLCQEQGSILPPSADCNAGFERGQLISITRALFKARKTEHNPAKIEQLESEGFAALKILSTAPATSSNSGNTSLATHELKKGVTIKATNPTVGQSVRQSRIKNTKKQWLWFSIWYIYVVGCLTVTVLSTRGNTKEKSRAASTEEVDSSTGKAPKQMSN